MGSPSPSHSNNWAVIVSPSMFFLNYRHESNVLALYRTIKRLGIDDSHIILMNAEDMACNPRNPFPATIFHNESHFLNLYDGSFEFDYKGADVSVESFLRLLIGRHSPHEHRSKRLLSDFNSNIFIYITGHGGDGFVKFRDNQELTSQDLKDALRQMYDKGRYKEILLMVESCEASTLIETIDAPGIIATGSSIRGEMSFSYSNDYQLGQPVIDRFTKLTLEFFEGLVHSQPSSGQKTSKNRLAASSATLADLFKVYTFEAMDCTFSYRMTGGGGRYQQRALDKTPLIEFFGATTRKAVSISAPDLYPID
jgi:phosphatidylinositol glycan class K